MLLILYLQTVQSHDYRSLTMQEVEMAETRQNENQIK